MNAAVLQVVVGADLRAHHAFNTEPWNIPARA
jgi:hypothetical protein